MKTYNVLLGLRIEAENALEAKDKAIEATHGASVWFAEVEAGNKEATHAE